MANNEDGKVKRTRKRHIKKWDNFTINLNQAMQDENYFQDWILSGEVNTVGDLFPGESRDWITTLLSKWADKGDKNQFSLQALKIFCTIKGSDPNTVLGIQAKPKAKTNIPPTTDRIIYFAWDDVAEIVNAINKDVAGFRQKQKRFPFLIPIMCNRKDLILVCLQIDKDDYNDKIVKYEMIFYTLPHVCGLGGGKLEKIEDVRNCHAIYSTDKNCIKNLKERYRRYAEQWVITNNTFSSTFDEVNKLISVIFNRVKPTFRGKFFDFCPQADYYQTIRASNLDDALARGPKRSSGAGER